MLISCGIAGGSRATGRCPEEATGDFDRMTSLAEMIEVRGGVWDRLIDDYLDRKLTEEEDRVCSEYLPSTRVFRRMHERLTREEED